MSGASSVHILGLYALPLSTVYIDPMPFYLRWAVAGTTLHFHRVYPLGPVRVLVHCLAHSAAEASRYRLRARG